MWDARSKLWSPVSASRAFVHSHSILNESEIFRFIHQQWRGHNSSANLSFLLVAVSHLPPSVSPYHTGGGVIRYGESFLSLGVKITISKLLECRANWSDKSKSAEIRGEQHFTVSEMFASGRRVCIWWRGVLSAAFRIAARGGMEWPQQIIGYRKWITQHSLCSLHPRFPPACCMTMSPTHSYLTWGNSRTSWNPNMVTHPVGLTRVLLSLFRYVILRLMCKYSVENFVFFLWYLIWNTLRAIFFCIHFHSTVTNTYSSNDDHTPAGVKTAQLWHASIFGFKFCFWIKIEAFCLIIVTHLLLVFCFSFLKSTFPKRELLWNHIAELQCQQSQPRHPLPVSPYIVQCIADIYNLQSQ